MDSGLVATFIEAPLNIQQSITIPEDHLQICNISGVMTAGNAAGNTEDLYEMLSQLDDEEALSVLQQFINSNRKNATRCFDFFPKTVYCMFKDATHIKKNREI